MLFLTSLAFSMSLAAAVPAVSVVQDGAVSPAFDGAAAWSEFESIVRFRYAYLERAPGGIDALFIRAGALAAAAPTPAEFRRILQAVGYAFCDSHFVVGPLAADDANVIPTSSDLVIAWEGSRALVRDVRSGSAADAAGVRPGWEVVSLDGQEIRDRALELLCGVVAEPTPEQLDYAMTVAANGKLMGSRTMTFLRGTDDPVTLELPSPREYAMKVRDGPLWSFEQRGDIGVIRIGNSLGNNDLIRGFDEAILAAGDTRGLVLDLRNTPSGGNTEVARSIIGHFVDEVRSYQVHHIPSFDREFSVPRSFVEQVHPREPRYRKPFVVLAGHWTGSMGEGVVIGLDAAADGTTLASNMGDLLGAIHGYDLELSGLRLELGDEALVHVDGTPREDFVADVELASADRDAQGGDPGMKAALRMALRMLRD